MSYTCHKPVSQVWLGLVFAGGAREGRSPHCGAPTAPSHPPSQVFINYLKYLLIIKSDVHPLFSVQNELHNCTFYLEMTLKMALSVIFIIIFVISAPKYNNIPIDSEIGDFPFSELYPKIKRNVGIQILKLIKI